MTDIVFESLLNSSLSISRRSRIADGQGGWAIVYEPIDNISGRIRPASSAEREAARQESRAITHVLYVIDGENIERGDMVEVADEDLTLEVQGIREPSLADHHLEIDCLEKQYEVDTSAEIGS